MDSIKSFPECKETWKYSREMPIGLIGIGLVGTALATNLIAAGWRLYGFDLIPEKCTDFAKIGGIPCQNPAEVAQNAPIIMLSLLNSDVVNQAITGPTGVLTVPPDRRPKVIIDTTTGEPEKTVLIAEILRKNDIHYLDATISGSSHEIIQKNGVFLVGGEYDQFCAVEPLFQDITTKALYLGPAGSGVKAKLLVNLVMGLNRVALAEGFVFARTLGISPEKALELFKDTFAYSRVVDMKGQKMITEDFIPQARLSQHLKDVKLMIDAAQKEGQRLPLSEVHRALLEAGIAAGDGDLDVSALIRQIYREKVAKN